MKKITENELKNKVSRLREYLTVLEAGVASSAPARPAVPGMGQKGPTVAAAQGADPSNPLNKAPAAQSTKPAWPTDKASIIAFQKANKLTEEY